MAVNTYNELAGSDMPHSVETEQAVLGVMLVEPSSIPQVIEQLKPEHFYVENHQKLFGTILRLFSVGRDIDFVVLVNETVNMGLFQTEAMAKAYLGGIMDSLPSLSNIKNYCDIINDLYQRRCLIKAANDILGNARDGLMDASAALDSAEQKIFEIRQGRVSQGMSRIDDVIVPTLERISQLSGPDREKYLGTRTGFSKLDSVLIGMNSTDLIILAARPGMGKSAFALNMATNVCRSENPKSVCYFSLEMPAEQLVTRMLSSEALVNGYSLRDGSITADEWKNIARGADELAKMPIYLANTPGITVPQLKAMVRRVPNCGLVIIDHLHLMSSSESFGGNKVLQISEITRQLKLMAMELKIPVILLAQLNRSVENRPDKHPQLADLRESGSIEQDADVILFLYREGYYNKELSDQSTTECMIAKNRHGSTATVKLAFVAEYTLFRNIEYRDDEGAPQ